MTQREFNLIDAINRDGMSNEKWGVIRTIVSTKEYFGTVQDIPLVGQHLYIYLEPGQEFRFNRECFRDEPTELDLGDGARLLIFDI